MEGTARQVLLCRVATHRCAVKLEHVIEIMRALPVEPLAGAPEMVLGLSVIRGAPIAVVALAALFQAGIGAPKRFVVVQSGPRRVALAVDEVTGIYAFASPVYEAMPPLLRDAARGSIETIGALDAELLFLLNTSAIVPDEVLGPPAGQGG